jgi:hypothetical protein
MVLAQALAEYGLASMTASLQVAFGNIESLLRENPVLLIAGGFVLVAMVWVSLRRGGN